jgi:ComEC/Rec2-related protein
MSIKDSNNAFKGLCYWMRLPGFAAFSGICGGISIAKLCLSLYTPSIAIFYIKLLFLATIFSMFAGILCRRPFIRVALFVFSGAALFIYTEAKLHSFYQDMEQISEHNQILTLKVTITSPVVTSPYSTARFRCRVIGADNKTVEQALKNKTLRCVSRRPVPPVGTITIQGRYSAPQRAKGPGSFDERNHFAVNNIHGHFQISRILPDSAQSPPHLALFSHTLRTQVHSVINKAKSEEVRGIFHAAFLAENEYRSRPLDATFRKAGIVHLLAISGFHAALLLTAIITALKICGVPYRLRMILSVGALWGYLFFIGFIPSLFRTTVMVTFFCLSMLFQRRNHSIHSLGTAGLFWLYISPHSLFSAGFQLSFAATAGIILLQPILCTMTPKLHNKRFDFLLRQTITPFWLSVTASAATIPVLLHHFGTFSIYGLFFNPVAIPLMAAAMWFFFAAVILSPIAPLCGLSIWGAEKILSLIIYLSRFCENFALSEIIVADTTGLQLFAMSIFMIGLCAVRQNLRGLFLLRGGAAAIFLIAIVTLWSSTQTTIENSEFKTPHAAVNVILHPAKDKTAWITAQGKSDEVRKIREREVEPFLRRKKVTAVQLFIISEEAQKEAHEFIFRTGFSPHIIVLRDGYLSDENQSGYKKLDLRYLISSNSACSLKIGSHDAGRFIFSLNRGGL